MSYSTASNLSFIDHSHTSSHPGINILDNSGPGSQSWDFIVFAVEVGEGYMKGEDESFRPCVCPSAASDHYLEK